MIEPTETDSPPSTPVWRKPIEAIGISVIRALELIGGIGLLLGDTLRAAKRAFTNKRGRRETWKNLWIQLERVGVRAVPVVSLVTFCIGVILALQISPILEQYGAKNRLADLIAIATFRELGPLIGAITLTGFAGASIAAEIGTMVVGEEITALRAHAISPIRYLVVPRVLATAIMTTCLAVLSNLMGILGGMTASYFVLDINPRAYVIASFDAVTTFDLLTGLLKATVFGTTIGSLACYLGMGVRGGAEGVGHATTQTVVLTVVSLTIIDLMFTFVFFRFGW